MDIVSSHAYQGRSIYSHKPVVKIVVDLGIYDDIPTSELPGFSNGLTNLLPGLMKHQCSTGYAGGFAERLKEGTYLAHVIEHVALELQSMLGYDLSYGKARKASEKGHYNIIYAYRNEFAGLESGKLAVELITALLDGKRFSVEERIEQIKKLCAETDFGPSTAAIVEEAKKRGIPILRIDRSSLLQLGYGKKQKRIQATLTENASCIAVDTACNKDLTKEILSEYGIPVPQGRIVKNVQEALAYSEKLGYPVVVKPNSCNQGKGVSVNLKNPQEVLDAYEIAREFEETVMVEKYIKGNYYRVLVVDGKVAAVSQRISAFVEGDGHSTIQELVDRENSNPLRGEGHAKPLTKITIDKVSERFLKRQDLSLQYVPHNKEIIYLRENDNLSTGGVAIDMTDVIHERNRQLAVLAAQVIGLDVAGIDICSIDISKPLTETGGAVIEVNAAPGIRMHHYPYKGKARNAAGAIVDMLFPEGGTGTIPIVSVTGTNGKTTTVRMISNILKQIGYQVGMTTTSGIYLDNQLIRTGDNTGAISARTVLTDKRVDCAVLETARGGLISRGLGYDLADVGIVTNITEDHLGIDGIETLEDLAYVKSLVVEAVKGNGFAVLNADDPYCVGMEENVKARTIFFSSFRDNEIIRRHAAEGGTVVYSDETHIYVLRGGKQEKIAAISDIPATLDGILQHNIYNSLAAAAGCIGLGIPAEEIGRGLKLFSSSASDNPGRFNRFEVNGITVILDYGHNIDGYKVTLEALQKMKLRKLIGVIGTPGDRTDSSTVKVGELCGEVFDRVYIKEDKDRRGRKSGEIAALLEQGCRKGKIKASEIHIELLEEKALEKAILSADKGDIVIVYYEEYKPLIDVIERLKADLGSIQPVIA